jgi:hypothetical protein
VQSIYGHTEGTGMLLLGFGPWMYQLSTDLGAVSLFSLPLHTGQQPSLHNPCHATLHRSWYHVAPLLLVVNGMLVAVQQQLALDSSKAVEWLGLTAPAADNSKTIAVLFFALTTIVSTITVCAALGLHIDITLSAVICIILAVC